MRWKYTQAINDFERCLIYDAHHKLVGSKSIRTMAGSSEIIFAGSALEHSMTKCPVILTITRRHVRLCMIMA